MSHLFSFCLISLSFSGFTSSPLVSSLLLYFVLQILLSLLLIYFLVSYPLLSCLASPPEPGSAMPSKLEGAMDALITVFHHYSGSEGDKYKLSKGELKELLSSELTDFLMSQKDPMLVEKIMNDLDSNKDNEVDFNEFVVLVAALTVACNDFFQEQQKKKSK
ncbi:hypothetical protein DNTS_024611 [Danionella cerebrum]|uniref:EF-hand domain-containing protein n=1 Tax=Danionella cerebrum TaxID=2873325 RepID=A0A553NHK1_9TELE|nr:hypothetical protein DNTS_024611 [Danionella translucida]